ncbi:glutaredoxin [Lacrimispora amygdalina]|uniref:Glutaredoxin n=1 Tax=Lacrimispora amygdalina TaxID=253257 RepID=A0A3E2NIZ1_9FIRM|nr:glutaredoxin domain-containing protein [Clostridium indicum]RFZ80972.1 glutaredoxin [Clostridium indicum]
MKIIMYGTEICPDCVAAKAQLGELTAVELDYRNITKNTATLKEFLSHRDHDEMFKPVKEEGRIGIPFFILEDGTQTFDIADFIDDVKAQPVQNACSIDGKGC